MEKTRRLLLSRTLACAAAATIPLFGPFASAKPARTAVPVGSLQALLARFKQSPGMSAKFTETKHITLLRTPIVNSGRLYFHAPGSFARHIDRPFPSSVIVDQSKVTLWDGAKKQILPLEKHPALAKLTTTFLALLGGDYAALTQNYKPTFTNQENGWTLELVPKPQELRRLLKSLTVYGRGTSIKRMRLVEASGDRAETVFTETNAPRRFTEAEVSRYFSVKRS